MIRVKKQDSSPEKFKNVDLILALRNKKITSKKNQNIGYGTFKDIILRDINL